jgi:hypothetical protein
VLAPRFIVHLLLLQAHSSKAVARWAPIHAVVTLDEPILVGRPAGFAFGTASVHMAPDFDAPLQDVAEYT